MTENNIYSIFSCDTSDSCFCFRLVKGFSKSEYIVVLVLNLNPTLDFFLMNKCETFCY